jgi:hypothetical protein
MGPVRYAFRTVHLQGMSHNIWRTLIPQLAVMRLKICRPTPRLLGYRRHESERHRSGRDEDRDRKRERSRERDHSKHSRVRGTTDVFREKAGNRGRPEHVREVYGDATRYPPPPPSTRTYQLKLSLQAIYRGGTVGRNGSLPFLL